MSPQQSQKTNVLRRFLFCYVVLYIFPYGFEYIYSLDTNDLSFWTHLVPWFGKTFLGLTYDPENLGKGIDSKYDFTRFLLCVVLACAITFLWHIIDKKYKWNYEDRLRALLTVIVRYHVGLTLILYGLCKVLPVQFGKMGFDDLAASVGDLDPMSFLWTFMRYSRFYAASTGWIEVIGGALLLFRRTAFIGAVTCFIVMANVVLMDIGYDVTVKMFAIHLFLMTILLLAGNAKRLFDFFVLNRPTASEYLPDLLTSQNAKSAGYLLKAIILVSFVVTTASFMKKMINVPDAKSREFATFLKVEQFVINGDTLPPLLTDTLRWNTISVSGFHYLPSRMTIKRMDNKKLRFTFKMDTLQRKLTFQSIKDSTDRYVMTYERLPGNRMILKGNNLHDSIWIKAKSITRSDYALTKDGIQWVRDY